MDYKNSKKDISYPIILALVLIVGIFVGINLNKNSEKPSLMVYPKTDKLSSILNYIHDEYVDSISIKTLVESTIPSVLKNLDPHSVYIPAEDFESVNAPLEGEFDGIGIQFNMNSDTATVISVIPNGPSEHAGILPGDRIVRVNGKNIAGIKFPFDSVPKLLKGPNGTTVNVAIIRRELKDTLHFDLVRDKIPINSVDISYMVTPTIGYIKISTFAKTTYDEFMAGIDKIRKQGMKSLILDLRSNSGGYMDAATRIANEFLPVNRLIVYTKGKNRPRHDNLSNGRGSCIDLDVKILIDEFSASASEILAGAIQDNDRGQIIGRRSFGKGLVQEQIFFSDGSALRLTIARYYTPSGRSIQKPYTPGDDDYFYDISKRYMHGEFQIKDSIQLPDSLKFQTVGGRSVYGGGGIMPDIFVPLDTIGITSYYEGIARRNLVYRFAFNFVEVNRKQVLQLKNFEQVDGYLKKFNLLNDFVTFAQKNGIPKNNADLAISKDIINAQLKAIIARNIIDNEGFYPYYKEIDKTLQTAITCAEKE